MYVIQFCVFSNGYSNFPPVSRRVENTAKDAKLYGANDIFHFLFSTLSLNIPKTFLPSFQLNL